MKGRPVTILLVEDDPAHAEIARRNFEECRVANHVIHLTDGQAALDYLFPTGSQAQADAPPRPDLVLLDLRLPKVDGLEVLAAMKGDAELKRIPVVILTTSAAEQDILRAYENQVSSYLVKPVDFEKLTKMMETFGYYWLAWNEYPH